MSDQKTVLCDYSDGVAQITLNRPERLNAISKNLVDNLVAAMLHAQDNDDVKVIVLTGAGKAFCAGVDLKELSEGGSHLSDDSHLMNVFANCRKPLLGAINGYAITGGLEMALNCDFLYAADTARFGDTHAKVGLMPTWGMSQKLPRIIGINRAREMSLSGRLIDAQTALEWGLVNKVCSPGELLPTTMKTAREIAANQSDAVAGIRNLINRGWESNLVDGLRLEEDHSRPFNAAVDVSVMSDRLRKVKKDNH